MLYELIDRHYYHASACGALVATIIGAHPAFSEGLQ